MKNGKKTGDKIKRIAFAAGGGVAGNLIVSMGQGIKVFADLDPKIQRAIPLLGAFFAFDLDESFALGMAGVAGGNLGHEFGIGEIGDMTEDDLSGLEGLDEMNGITDIGSVTLQGMGD